jgi:hypothetical protein
MKSPSVLFVPNVPQQMALKYEEPRPCRSGFRMIFWLLDGRRLFVSVELAKTIQQMGIRAGEPFSICKHWNGLHGRGSKTTWDVWLTPQAEKARAEEEAQVNAGVTLASKEDLTPLLEQSVREMKSGILRMPVLGVSSPVAGTGTNGAAAQPRTAPKRSSGERIPFDVAFREAVGIVKQGLEENGEQWSDAARQDMVSTFLIALSNMGLLCLWERP